MKSHKVPKCCIFCAFVAEKYHPAATDPYTKTVVSRMISLYSSYLRRGCSSTEIYDKNIVGNPPPYTIFGRTLNIYSWIGTSIIQGLGKLFEYCIADTYSEHFCLGFNEGMSY